MNLLQILSVIIIVVIIKSILNKKGISIGNYKKNFPLKFFLFLFSLGIFLKINSIYVEYEYFLKEVIEPTIIIVFIYIIIALLNRKNLLNKIHINDITGALLITLGVLSFIFFLMI
ncbi:hypothetical protein [Ornithinibacillus halotolerans]|uniref:Uncharacterized protein n=1 Tax=Ornithinibacillus halotolerans TaxID=1274357 RepID=A0A916S2M4_9BACI|nr:hypothetical protein [Ornithinibacillus halotolerans]GGA80451.1 hypothetical protein GCM10008025_24820 [Ornithinibacillus halotolerans]